MTTLGRRSLAGAATGAAVLVAVTAGMLGFLRGEPAGQSFDEAVTEIMTFVERERGLTFLEQPTIVVAGPEGLSQRERKIAAKAPDDRAKESDLHLTLGILPPDVDLAEQLNALRSVSVLAIYDAETRVVALRNTSLTPFARATLAHELTHALDDQHFGLHRPALGAPATAPSSDSSRSVRATAAGSSFAYLATLTEAEQREAYAERTGLGRALDSTDVHPYLGLYVDAPYEYGLPLVTAILDHGGQRALDDALVAPDHP